MAVNRLFSQIAIVTICSSFLIVIEASMITITNMTCNVDTELCKNNICKLEPIRKGTQILDFACYFAERQDNITFRLSLYKLGNGGRRIVDTTEDFCKVTANEGATTAMTRLFPSVKMHGTFFSKCPLQGNITIMRYPVDFSFVPIVLTPGNYRLTGVFKTRESRRKLPIVHANLYFYVRNIFKNH